MVISLPLCIAAAGFPSGISVAQGNRHQVRIGLSLEPETLDPTVSAASSIGGVVHGNIFEGLTKLTESGNVLPSLAESWTISTDGTRYIFNLKKGIRFHDGANFDASTVNFSFERAIQAGKRNKLKETLFDNIVSIFTPDVHTVEIVFQHADPHILFRLAESPAVILHPDTASQAEQHPVGTGPYVFAGRKVGESITLKRWPDYRDARQITIRDVTFRFIDDPDRQAEYILHGEIDLLFNIATESVDSFLTNNHYEVLMGSSSSKGLLAINNTRPPLNDVRIRRAIMHAIDREGFIRDALDGRARAIGSHFAPTDPGYLNLTGMYPYDPDTARALLHDAGVTTPLDLTLTLPPTPYARTGGPIIAQALEDIGIHVTQKHLSWSEWLTGPFTGDFDLTIINHVEPLDYHIYTRPDYYFGYDSPAFRDLFQRHKASSNARERRTLFHQIQRHLAEDSVNAWLFTPQLSTVVRKGLKGVWMNYPIFCHDVSSMYWE